MVQQEKKTSISTSTAEAEHIADGSYCAQLLWIQQQLRYYEIQAVELPLFCEKYKCNNYHI